MAAGKAKLQNNGLEIHYGFGSIFLRPQALNVVLCGNHHLICTYADAAPTSLSNFSSFLTTASTAKAVRPTATTPIMDATHCTPVLAVSRGSETPELEQGWRGSSLGPPSVKRFT